MHPAIRILGLSTYPVRFPVHGGQRRIAAFAQYYASLGAAYSNVCVYEAPAYGRATVGQFDIPLVRSEPDLRAIPFVGDLESGQQAARSPRTFARILAAAKTASPRILQVEQPFMWPAARRLRSVAGFEDVRIIYSSQNWEAPLKQSILQSNGVSMEQCSKIAHRIEALERDCASAADLVIAVSEADANIYRQIAPRTPVIVVPNGVDRRPPQTLGIEHARLFEDRKVFFFVGSAYPPNIEGFCNLVLESGLYFTPPEFHFAVCGGVAHGIFASQSFQKLRGANSARIAFFPDISDVDLAALKARCHAFLLPIEFGGGSNLKTAEAIASGKWVVATPTALRGFETFAGDLGIRTAEGPADFNSAMVSAFHAPPLRLNPVELRKREQVHWDRCFEASSLKQALDALTR